MAGDSTTAAPTEEELAKDPNFKPTPEMVAAAEAAYEPAPKRAKTDKVSRMNIRKALCKKYENRRLSELLDEPVDILEGISDVRQGSLNSLKLSTVRSLAEWKFYRVARAMVDLATAEQEDCDEECGFNLNKALCKSYETMTLAEVLEAPISALEQLTETHVKTLEHLHINSIRDLGTNKWFRWADAMLSLSVFDSLES